MTQVWPIHGGIHPAENKHQSMALACADLPLPAVLVLPLNQHLGAPAEPCVTVGERVRTGQMIAEFENQLAVKKVGDAFSFGIDSEEAYGG